MCLIRFSCEDDASWQERLQNTVKVCPKCGKACALDERWRADWGTDEFGSSSGFLEV